MIINVEDVKKEMSEFYQIPIFDEEMTFYYDESGNCRKFLLTKKGFNNEDSIKGDFVLAGVAHEGKTFELNMPELYKIFHYQPSQKELKFKHLYHNSSDFISFMESDRLTKFIKWLDESGLYIHYSTMNNLFYSLVDIIDSLYETHPMCAIYFSEIKSAFYDFVLEHQDEIVNILIKHTYPNVKNVQVFCDELCFLISNYNDDTDFYPGFFLEFLRQMLKTAGKLEKMVFIQDNEENVLIDEYYCLYLERCEIFSKSLHIFDEENEVQEKFKNIQLFDNREELKNWIFTKSTENNYVQISDLVAGLLRKLFMFLDSYSINEINEISSTISSKQVTNFSIILSLIDKSNTKSLYFIKNANSGKNINDRLIKLKILSSQ